MFSVEVGRRAFDTLCERATDCEVRGGVLGEKRTVQNWMEHTIRPRSETTCPSPGRGPSRGQEFLQQYRSRHEPLI